MVSQLLGDSICDATAACPSSVDWLATKLEASTCVLSSKLTGAGPPVGARGGWRTRGVQCTTGKSPNAVGAIVIMAPPGGGRWESSWRPIVVERGLITGATGAPEDDGRRGGLSVVAPYGIAAAGLASAVGKDVAPSERTRGECRVGECECEGSADSISLAEITGVEVSGATESGEESEAGG